MSALKSFSSCFLTMDSNFGQLVSKKVKERPLAMAGVPCASETDKQESSSNKRHEHRNGIESEDLLEAIAVYLLIMNLKCPSLQGGVYID